MRQFVRDDVADKAARPMTECALEHHRTAVSALARNTDRHLHHHIRAGLVVVEHEGRIAHQVVADRLGQGEQHGRDMLAHEHVEVENTKPGVDCVAHEIVS